MIVSIKPINYQVMLPKTEEVSKLNSEEQQRSHLSQQQQAVRIQKKATDNLKQVHSRDGVGESKVREKQESEHGQKHQQKDDKDQKDKDSKGKEFKHMDKTSTIDIRL